MKSTENDQQDYYTEKQSTHLELFKTEIKIVFLIIIFGVGYWSYEHKHFTTFIITTFVIGVYYFLYKLFLSIGKRNQEYKKTHKDI